MTTFEKVKLDGSYVIGLEHPQMGTIELNMTAPQRRPNKTEAETERENEAEMDAVEKLLRQHFAEVLKEIRKMRKC